MLSQMAGFSFSFFVAEEYSVARVCRSLFTHSSIPGHLGVHASAIENDAAGTMAALLPSGDYVEAGPLGRTAAPRLTV